MTEITFTDIEKLNSRRISQYESLIKIYKELLSDLYRANDINYPDWYKELLREGKNKCEVEHKLAVLEQLHHRSGLNPPQCYI